jgi:bacterioferritin-associated ferredoxin
MYVCICNAVTERDIDNAIRDGASDLGDLKERLQVGTCCGACETSAADYLSGNLQGQKATTRACRRTASGESGFAARVG